MTRKQYQLILALYHNYNEAFKSLSQEIKDKYFDILYSHNQQFTDSPIKKA